MQNITLVYKQNITLIIIYKQNITLIIIYKQNITLMHTFSIPGMKLNVNSIPFSDAYEIEGKEEQNISRADISILHWGGLMVKYLCNLKVFDHDRLN